ncbi:hypothetical protein FACS1894217_05550 [Clostridia bacterium]|nr:hypothetical protein FACS1894217_05550 [Clostridia bacterium]
MKLSSSVRWSYALKWLNRYEWHEGENEPNGLILAEGNREHIEFLEKEKTGVMALSIGQLCCRILV